MIAVLCMCVVTSPLIVFLFNRLNNLTHQYFFLSTSICTILCWSFILHCFLAQYCDWHQCLLWIIVEHLFAIYPNNLTQNTSFLIYKSNIAIFIQLSMLSTNIYKIIQIIAYFSVYSKMSFVYLSLNQ
ncbi:hypothetical protein BDF19DRAFT_452636 [Syncephalis fuscata]|nr:hypothetical protein BDF19DRAFT_452636 [Syncephalis fuscata]